MVTTNMRETVDWMLQKVPTDKIKVKVNFMIKIAEQADQGTTQESMSNFLKKATN